MQKQTKLIHISDIHFALDHMTVMDMIRFEGLISKRILGWINYRLNRRDQFSQATRLRLSDYLMQADWDYLVISGDLTILSLEEEFKAARKWIEPLIQKGTVILTPGNHDRYVPGALKPDLMRAYFPDCFPFSITGYESEEIHCLELSDQAVLIEIDMSVPRKLFSSRGRIKPDLGRIHQLIEQQYDSHCKIVVGHYPVAHPEEISDIYLHRLAGSKQLSRFLSDNRIDLYLHGHIHKTWQLKTGRIHPLIHLNSGGCFKYNDGPWAGCHQITITNNTFEIEKLII